VLNVRANPKMGEKTVISMIACGTGFNHKQLGISGSTPILMRQRSGSHCSGQGWCLGDDDGNSPETLQVRHGRPKAGAGEFHSWSVLGPGQLAEGLIHNEDVIKMVKAGLMTR